MTERERIVERIKKLMSFSSANATAGEVENAVKLAQKLMRDLNIQEADLQGDGKKAEFSLQAVLTRKGKLERMDYWLFACLQSVFNCVGFTEKWNGQHTAKLAGHALDAKLTCDMINELRIWMRAAARQKYGSKWGVSHTSFCEGFSYGLQQAVDRWRDENAKAGLPDPTYRRDQTLEWLWEAHRIDFRPAKPSPATEGAADELVKKLISKKPKKTRRRKQDALAFVQGQNTGAVYDMGAR